MSVDRVPGLGLPRPGDREHARLGGDRRGGGDRPRRQDVLVPARRVLPRQETRRRTSSASAAPAAPPAPIADMWQDWTSYRRFRKLPPRDRSIVFYSETHQDWHHLQPLIDFLIERLVAHGVPRHLRADGAAARRPPRRPPRLPHPAGRGLHVVLPERPGRRHGADDARSAQLPPQALASTPCTTSTCSTAWAARTWWTTRTRTTTTTASSAWGPTTSRRSAGARQLHGLPPKHLFPHGYPRLERLVESPPTARGRHRGRPPCCSRRRGASSRSCTSAGSR